MSPINPHTARHTGGLGQVPRTGAYAGGGAEGRRERGWGVRQRKRGDEDRQRGQDGQIREAAPTSWVPAMQQALFWLLAQMKSRQPL